MRTAFFWRFSTFHLCPGGLAGDGHLWSSSRLGSLGIGNAGSHPRDPSGLEIFLRKIARVVDDAGEPFIAGDCLVQAESAARDGRLMK